MTVCRYVIMDISTKFFMGVRWAETMHGNLTYNMSTLSPKSIHTSCLFTSEPG